MRLINLNVKGELGCTYDFEKINVLLGDNNSGKSTFIKLILYSLGAPIKSFIDEISKKNCCESVSLDVEFKNEKKVRILRKLPNSDMVIVTPIKNNEDLVNDEILAFSLEEFSDYLLENEEYSADKITYSKDKQASFRFYFLLRAVYVDQDTPAQSILSDLDMGHGYFTNQPLIKKSIIEKLLGKDNTELQRIRVEIQNLTKTQTALSERITFLAEQKKETEQKYELDNRNSETELAEIVAEKNILSMQEYEKVFSVKAINDIQITRGLISKQSEIRRRIERQQVLKLELEDIESVIKSLSQDMVLLKYKTAAKDILEDLPILYCPNCLSPLAEEVVKKGLCENCNKKTVEERIINSATLKKTISDSIVEANEINQIKKNELGAITSQISDLQYEIQEEKKHAFKDCTEEKGLIYKAISEIKTRLEYLIKREQLLKSYRKVKTELDRTTIERKNNNTALKELKESLLKADTRASFSMQHLDTFKTCFTRYLRNMFSDILLCELDENYMPLIDSNKVSYVSSASLKVAIRLSYALALFNSEIDSKDKNYSHLGLLFLDSPKDKDLDEYRFVKYLKMINNECAGQIIITGSSSDSELYKKNLTTAKFFESLLTSNKLLKRKKNELPIIHIT